MYLQDMKILWAMLSLGQLYTEDNTNDDNAAAAATDNNDDDNDTRWTNHDCIDSNEIFRLRCRFIGKFYAVILSSQT